MEENNLFVAILVISVLLLAGCGEKECKIRDDCTGKGSCWIASCVKNSCDYKLRSGCTCGDDLCDKSKENECTCPADCGKCSGSVGTIMEKKCVSDVCVSQLKGQEDKVVEDVISFEELKVVKLQMGIKVLYPEPFDVKRSLMRVDIKIDKVVPELSDVKITKVKIIEHTGAKDRYGKWLDDDPKTLADLSYSKILYDSSMLFSKEFPVFIEGLDPAKLESKNVVLEVSYEFKYIDRYKNSVTGQALFEKEFSVGFVSPDSPVECPVCNDNNPCTQDVCSSGTNFFCQHRVSSSGICCGDDVCSPEEDRCRCPQDCGQCSGDVGDYMAMGCNSLNMCSFKIRNPNIVKPNNKLADFTVNGASMNLKVSYDNPFDKSSSVFSVVLDPKIFTDIRSVVLKKITILDKENNILGEASGNIAVNPGSVSSASAVMNYKILDAEEKKYVSVRLDFSAEVKDRSGSWNPAFPSYTYSIGDITVLNPG